MDGMLSQDEINALLNGMDLSGNGGDAGSTGAADDTMTVEDYSADSGLEAEALSEMERDAIGEVANISMGSSATTLYSLVNRKVNITTPVVELAQWKSMIQEYERPCVFIQIKYTLGLDGSNILVLKENDVKIITDLMMGGDGTNTDGELGELHLSAISEAMNQMMGSAATSLSTMLGLVIDISPPNADLLNLAEYADGSNIAPFLGGTFVKISFRMQIGDLVDSTIMQLYPVEFAKKIVDTFIGIQMGAEPESAPAPAPEPAPQPDMSQMGMQPQMGMPPQPDMSQMGMQPQMGMPPQPDMSQMGMQPQMGMPPYGYPPMPPYGYPPMGMQPQMMGVQSVNVQPAQFQSFSNTANTLPGQENIGLIRDVPLEVTVELGRTTKSIADILEFSPGTIIELDRIAGEPIDVLVNGKFVAKGEVVVIEESFGIRVTEIINH